MSTKWGMKWALALLILLLCVGLVGSAEGIIDGDAIDDMDDVDSGLPGGSGSTFAMGYIIGEMLVGYDIAAGAFTTQYIPEAYASQDSDYILGVVHLTAGMAEVPTLEVEIFHAMSGEAFPGTHKLFLGGEDGSAPSEQEVAQWICEAWEAYLAELHSIDTSSY